FYIAFSAILAAICYFKEKFENNMQTYLLIDMPILILLSMPTSVASITLKGAANRQHDIACKNGIIWQRGTIFPVARVQHI
ncbi:hypothetical protein CWB57_18820, partial [Pseudoalteromonas sp. S186]